MRAVLVNADLSAATPRAEQLGLPPEYGTPSRLVAWESVVERLAKSKHYWLATVRADGRPHVVPVDGLWLDNRWYHGGSAQTVRHRNLMANPQASLHLDDGRAAVIVEGTCAVVVPSEATAERLAADSKQKYGYGVPASTYLAGVWALSPVKALAWTELPVDATRFLFAEEKR